MSLTWPTARSHQKRPTEPDSPSLPGKGRGGRSSSPAPAAAPPLATLIAGAARLFAGAEVQWLGADPDSAAPRLYFANHTSHLDTAVLWTALPAAARARTRPVAAADYWDADPCRRYVARTVFRAILIDRRAVSARRNPVDAILAAMAPGESAILFPEGTRGAGVEPAAFKCGLYHLARRRPDLELVPVHLHNVGRVLPKGEWLPLPLRGRVRFGPPLRPEPGETKDAFLARARGALVELGRC